MGEVEKTNAMRRIEEERGQPIDEVLRQLYIQEGLSIRQVAARLGLSESTVWSWLGKFDIPTRQWRMPPPGES